MVKFPPDFVKTHYVGYFWSIEEDWLYSIKSGILRPLKLHRGYVDTRTGKGCAYPHFQLSVMGMRKSLPRHALKTNYSGRNQIHGTVPIERR